MNTSAAPIATATSLSVLLHAAAITAALLIVEQTTSTGRGLEIQLVSSTVSSDQQETEQSHNNKHVDKTGLQPAVKTMPAKAADNRTTKADPQQLLSSVSSDDRVKDSVVRDGPAEGKDAVQNVQHGQPVAGDIISTAVLVQSTNAKQQRHSILELLHSTISNNKEYPYLARRQRREGVATIGFVLHPDGTIQNTHLVTSSRTMMLDRAALTAVKRIEPFTPAGDYIEQAEEFKIDIVFKLL